MRKVSVLSARHSGLRRFDAEFDDVRVVRGSGGFGVPHDEVLCCMRRIQAGFFAMSGPIVLACPTDAFSRGRSTPPPRHVDAVGGVHSITAVMATVLA